MGQDYIPRPDGDFSAWIEQFASALKPWWITHGQDAAGLDQFQLAINHWREAWPAHVSAQALAESARADKDAARRELGRAVRPLAMFVQTFLTTTDAERAMMGLTVPGSAIVASGRPVSRPLVEVRYAQRLVHRLMIRDESTPTRKARPKGTLGAEVWRGLAEPGQTPSADAGTMTFLKLATAGELLARYPAEEGGRTATYLLRWLAPGGAVGPWSEPVSATVAA